jgi:uncharacterized protein (DUF2267 family)
MVTTHEAKAAEERHIGFRWLCREAGLGTEQEAEAVRAVARLLAERIGRDEARHVASHLPLGPREIWHEETIGVVEAMRKFHRAELIAAVQARLGVERPEDAEALVEIVFAWLKHLAPEEREDVSARLPPISARSGTGRSSTISDPPAGSRSGISDTFAATGRPRHEFVEPVTLSSAPESRPVLPWRELALPTDVPLPRSAYR